MSRTIVASRRSIMAFCFAVLSFGSASGQPLFDTVISIDCIVLNSDAVVIGKVVDFRELGPVNGLPTYAAIVAVEETLRGKHHERLPIRLTNLNSILAKSNPRRLLLVAAQGDPPFESRGIDLSDNELQVFTADFKFLRESKDVIQSAKEAIRRMPGVQRIDKFRLAVPREAFTGTKWDTNHIHVSLEVPVDERLEKRALDYLASKSYSQRVEGAQALRYFKSDENIARIKSLLEDPGWAYSEHAEDNFGIEVRHFGIRQAAYETLEYWGVAAEKPVVREEVEKLDSVQSVVLSEAQLAQGELTKLARLKNLRSLYLKDTPVGDAHLKELSAYSDLESLDLANTQVTDAGLKHLAGLKQLRYLLLDVTKVSDAGLKELASLHNLEHVYLSGTRVTDAGLQDLTGLDKLALIDLTNTQITDAGLAVVAKLKSLQEIYLRETSVTPEGVARLQKLHPKLKIHR